MCGHAALNEADRLLRADTAYHACEKLMLTGIRAYARHNVSRFGPTRTDIAFASNAKSRHMAA